MNTSLYTPEPRSTTKLRTEQLTLCICPLNWFGRPKKTIYGRINNFHLGGLVAYANANFKLEQRLLISIENDDHRLQSIPVVVTRSEALQQGQTYTLKFALGELPEHARITAYSVLKMIENSLIYPPHAA